MGVARASGEICGAVGNNEVLRRHKYRCGAVVDCVVVDFAEGRTSKREAEQKLLSF